MAEASERMSLVVKQLHSIFPGDFTKKHDIMKKIFITLGLAAMTIAGANAQIVINEIRRDGNFATNEYMEFLITADISQAELNSYIFGDSTSSTNAKFSAYQFNLTGFTTIRAGTIISVGGSDVIPSDDTTYGPVTGGGTNDGGVKILL